MSVYRLDISVQEPIEGDEAHAEQRSLVLVFTEDETVMAAALRAYADILDPKDPAAIRKWTERAERAGRPGSQPRSALRDEDFG